MEKTATTRVWLLTAALWLGLNPLNPALASPAANPNKITERGEARPSEQRQSGPRMLDLHLPAAMTLGGENPATASFPNALRRTSLGGEEYALPKLGAHDGPQSQARIPGRAEEFAQRVRREGLPVARLWENKAALVSLGLNQKGKLGLWLVQKVH